MFSKRGMMFFVVPMLLVFNEIEACFRTSKHEHISITTGTSYYKECQCTEPGYSIHDLRWLNNNGEPIGRLRSGTEKVYTEEQNDNLNLYISSITKTMSGSYKCETKVDGVTYVQSYTIEAYEPLYFYKTPHDQHLIYGQSSNIMCQPKSDTTVNISWQKENEEEVIDISDNDKYLVANDRLIINNVTESDAGRYKCTAQVIVTNEIVDKFIQVKVVTMPIIKGIKATPQNYIDSDDLVSVTVVAGNNLTIECIADGTPHPEYFWNKTLEVAKESKVVPWRQEINTIIFDQITPEDEGIYRCHAYNIAGTSTKEVLVEVLIAPKIYNFTNITDVEGATIQIICNATGKPEPSISIIYVGTIPLYDDDINVTNSDIRPNMELMVLDRSKEGFYFCEAINQAGVDNLGVYVNVLHQPYFEVQNERAWGWEGKTITLNCEHDSDPPAKITWRYYGNNIQTTEEVEINRRLLASLNNMPQPVFTFTIDNETAYGDYECTAINMYGKATKHIRLEEGFRPGALRDVMVEEPTATSITFNLTGPEYNHDRPEVIGFTATYDEAKNYNITDIHINRTWAVGRPYKLGKLKPNTTYFVKFAAVNEVGPGVWSGFYSFTTLEKSVPEAPVWDEEPISLATNSHVLKWRAPIDNGEPIDSYTLRYCPEEDEEACKSLKITLSSEESTEVELVDLEFNTTYLLELVAHNTMGDSVASNITVLVPAPQFTSLANTTLSEGAIIGISIVIVVLSLLLLDVLLLVWRRQGIIATCCFKKDTKTKENALNFRDKKGLLTNGESEDQSGSRNNGHKEFQYNKNTGTITGKHSAV